MASRLDPPPPSLRDALRNGGIFSTNLGGAMQSTWDNLRNGPQLAPSFEQQNMAANHPAAAFATPGFAPGRPALNEATGNGIFGLPLPKQEQQNIQGLSGPVQLAGLLTGAGQRGQMADFSQRLTAAGVNPFDPSGQSPGQFSQGVTAAQGIYNNVFATPGTSGASPGSAVGLPQGVPVHSFAPTDLRQTALDADGAPVTGFGGTQVSALPNGQGGTGFRLTQNPATLPAPGGAAPAPGAVSSPGSVSTSSPTPFQQNSSTFNSAIVSPQKAIAAAFAPGVTDHLGEYVKAAGGHVDKDMLKTISDITLKRQAADAKAQSNDALKKAYGTDTSPDKPATDSAAPDAVSESKAHLSNYINAGGSDHTVINKMSSNIETAKKQVQQQETHKNLLSQVNLQNDRLMEQTDQAIKLAGSAGPIAGHLVGHPGGTDVTRLHALIGSIGSNEMMDYIQRMKANSATGSTGIGRILDREADAMTNTIAALKDHTLPAERLDPEFLRGQLRDLQYYSYRLNMTANGIDPDTRTFTTAAQAEAAAKAGKIAPGDKVLVGKRPAVWK